MAEIERYERPASLAEAVALLRGGEVTVLAGGTDLMPQTRAGARAFRPVLMNITRLPELRGIEEKAGAIRIGALTTITEILDSPLVGGRLPVLAQAAGCFASDQLRNWATVGGNIANASPAGDMIVPLLLLDAELELAGAGEGGGGQGTVESRRVALKDFFTGPGQTRLEPHEILVAIHLPRPVEGFVAGFEKFGARPALDISLVSVGIAGVRGNGALTNARVAMGAVAPTPMRGYRSEAALDGRPLDDEAIQAVADTAAGEIDPISDVRGSAWYRRQLVANLSKRILRGVS